MANGVSWKVGGAAGEGIASVGATFAKCLQRSGLNVFGTNDYPSLIKGGHNTYAVRGDAEEIFCQRHDVDVLIVLNKNTITKNGGELARNGAVIFDGDKVKIAEGEVRKDVLLLNVPLSSVAQRLGAPIYANTVALGASVRLLGMDFELLAALIRESFGRKKGDVAEKNVSAAREGYDFIEKNYSKPFHLQIQKLPPKDNLLLIGNDAVCAGAIKAGCKFVSEYPMSPSSSILHYMAAHERQYGIIVKHAEDEIAAMNMIVGAGFAGARAMTATSGGGFALMVEALGLAGIAEVPVVVVNVQRAGPSTGLPTYTEQADLEFALHASQGEFPRVVLAPGDVEECFYETFHAFNLAERLQTPVILLSDKYLAEAMVTVKRFDTSKMRVDRGKLASEREMESAKDFKRYAFSPDGVSVRSIPGQPNGLYVGTSYEHDETSWTSEDAKNKIAMVDKRARKFSVITGEEIAPKVYGDEDPDLTMVVWGSTKMPALEALKLLSREGFKVSLVHLYCLEPFPSKQVGELLSNAKKLLMIEGNSTVQCRNLIREKTGVFIENTYLRYDGRPFEAVDICAKVKELLNSSKNKKRR